MGLFIKEVYTVTRSIFSKNVISFSYRAILN